MSKGRTPRYPAGAFRASLPPTDGYRRAMDADLAFFRANPHTAEYSRAYVPGECSPDMPAGTIVNVLRVGVRRVRGFVPPQIEGVN